MCEHEILEPVDVLLQSDIWWDIVQCKECGHKFKTCHNHWGLQKVD